jgi:hypothetical protein
MIMAYATEQKVTINAAPAVCISKSIPPEKPDRLMAQWLVIEGKLVCKWIVV